MPSFCPYASALFAAGLSILAVVLPTIHTLAREKPPEIVLSFPKVAGVSPQEPSQTTLAYHGHAVLTLRYLGIRWEGNQRTVLHELTLPERVSILDENPLSQGLFDSEVLKGVSYVAVNDDRTIKHYFEFFRAIKVGDITMLLCLPRETLSTYTLKPTAKRNKFLLIQALTTRVPQQLPERLKEPYVVREDYDCIVLGILCGANNYWIRLPIPTDLVSAVIVR